MKKNLGGDRLGSGAKNAVELHSYQKSTHNLDKITRTTMGAGTLVPIFCELMQQGDDWEIDIDALIQTHPTEGPLFGSFKVQVDVFTAPMRLYQGKMHMNLMEQGTAMNQIKIPQIEVNAKPLDWQKDVNNQQVNPSSLLAYLGIRGIGNNAEETYRRFNGMPVLMYYDIYGQYYANQQEKVGYIIHAGVNQSITSAAIWDTGGGHGIAIAPATGSVVLTEALAPYMQIAFTGNMNIEDVKVNLVSSGLTKVTDIFTDVQSTGVGVYTLTGFINAYDGEEIVNIIQVQNDISLPEMFQFPLANINEMKMDILADVKNTSAFIINDASIAPYGTMLGINTDYVITKSQEGLACKTYQSDIFNNWLDTAAINAINTRSTIDTSGGGFTMESFLITEKLYKYLNRVQLAGNTVEDWNEVNWGGKGNTRTEKPLYEGGLSKELIFEQVVSNSATAEQPLGTLAGRGKLSGKHKGGKVRIKAEEHGFIMIIASLTPRLDYFQGNKWYNNLETLEDIHKSAFDMIGFQNLITDKMAFWDTTVAANVKTYQSAGKQPSWLDYQTNYNEVYGNFAIKSNEGWMVLTRDYEQDTIAENIKDLTTYIDPAKWNDVFAYKARDAQNFWAQFAVDAKVRRVISANQIPNL